MPFNPRLYDQWKADIAGVEIGNILFHFTQGNRILYCHMVLIPLGKKLVVLNFYHSTLQIMKHMTNIRETILRSLSLPKVEAAGGLMPGQFVDDIKITETSSNGGSSEFGDGSSFDVNSVSFDDNAFNDDTTFDNENSFSASDNEPSDPDDIPASYESNNSSSLDEDEDDDNMSWGNDSENVSSDDDDIDMLRPDSYVEDSDDGDEELSEPEPEIPSSGGYGDGHFGDDDDYGFDEGEEVAF